MSYKEFATNEINIFNDVMTKRLDDMDEHSDDYDPDYIGNEKQAYMDISENLTIVSHIMNNIPEDINQKSGLYISRILKNIFKGIPLSELNSYEDNKNEWVEWKNCWINDRYSQLIRRSIKIEGRDEPKIIYSDITRFQFYDLIKTRKVKINDLAFNIDGLGAQILTMLDQLFPISFPYNVETDKIKVYVELFECVLQEGMPPVKTLTLAYYINNSPVEDNRPVPIKRFFDISNGGINELDLKVYATRRQIFDKSLEISVENESDSHDNDVL